MPVKIGRVDIEWPNRVVLEQLYLEDQQGRELFRAIHVSAGMEMLPLLEGKLVFTTVRLFSPTVRLSKKTSGEPLNLQFVIDAFARKDSVRKDSDIDLRFNTVIVRKGSFSFDIEDAPLSPGKFNPKHIDVRNVSAKISLRAFNKDSLNAQVKKLSLDEASGFSLNKLTVGVVANRDSAYVTDFHLELPQTNLEIMQAHIKLPPVDSMFRRNLLDSPMRLLIAPSQISLKDISAFVPALKNFSDTISISASASGSINNIYLQNLTANYNQQLNLSGKMELKGISHPSEAYLFGRVDNMSITSSGLNWLINGFSKSPANLPAPVARMGTIDFTGEISGFFDNLVAYGKLSTSVGSIRTDLVFGKNEEKHIAAFLKGDISTSSLDFVNLFPEGNPFGKLKMNISIDAARPEGGHFAGKIESTVNEFDFKGYKYENITVNGRFRRNTFDGSLLIDDPNAYLHADGFFQNQGQSSVFNFMADVRNFRPDRLNLTRKYEEPDISFSLNADFSGNNIDNIEGNIIVDSIAFNTKPSNFFLKQFKIAASGHSLDRKLLIESDLLHGEVTGAYSFKTIYPSFMKTFHDYLPALIDSPRKNIRIGENNFSLLLTVQNTEDLSNTLKLPFTILSPGRITGLYNNQYNRFRLEAFLPHLKVGKTTFQSGYVDCDNLADKIELELRATSYNEKGRKNYLDLKLDAKDNMLNTVVNWANNKEKTFKAELSASAAFTENQEEKKKSLLTEIKLNPTRMILNDSVWNISPAFISLKDKRVEVKDIYVYHGRQYAKINGFVSPLPEDTLNLELNDIELSNIFDILNIPVLQFAGKATGKFNFNDLYGSRILNTDLIVRDFSFNKVPLGKLDLFSEWDDSEKGILMQGSIFKDDSTWTDVYGYVYPVKSEKRPPGLSLNFDANDINIAFLHPFVEKVVQGIKGFGSGSVRLYGPFQELNVEGNAFVRDGGLGVEFLNTYYTFSDSIFLDSKSVRTRNLKVYDKFNNSASVNLTFNHKHFRDYDFSVAIEAQNMLMYDASERHNPMIYGTVFGSGTARIGGNAQLLNFDINMKSEPQTSVYLNFMGGSKAAEYDFITFVDRKKLKADAQSKDSVHNVADIPILPQDEGAEMRMNFLLDITPDANIELIMDPNAGDRIKGYGSGSLQIQYGDKTDLRMYGNVGIHSGSYNFSLQQLIHKEFKIREGSIINFNGDPLEANMNINAIYNLTANIGDLDQNLALESPRTNVPVNCVLNLDGSLRSPKISFDLELPGSNEELERQMKSLVDTEDMMTRQIVYLLVLNKFYTPEYTGTKGSNDFTAVASSALSSQLSSLLNSITDKVQIGTNIRASEDGITDTEVEMLLSSQLLNNRLIFNGNFGYKNNSTQKNAFIGEFDLEYKLTKSGDIRLKAYNHANDLYQYLKQALTTQGVGIMFKRDFSNFSDMFRRRRFNLPFINKEKNDDKVSKADSTAVK